MVRLSHQPGGGRRASRRDRGERGAILVMSAMFVTVMMILAALGALHLRAGHTAEAERWLRQALAARADGSPPREELFLALA